MEEELPKVGGAEEFGQELEGLGDGEGHDAVVDVLVGQFDEPVGQIGGVAEEGAQLRLRLRRHVQDLLAALGAHVVRTLHHRDHHPHTLLRVRDQHLHTDEQK